MNSIGTGKEKIFIVAIFLSVFFNGCIEKEYVYLDVTPQLEITVKDETNNTIAGATVNLYNSEEDFYQKENPVQTKVTNGSGIVLFKDLSEIIYYFYAEKGELNNYYEVVTFAKPLRKNEIKSVNCIIR